jgi:hypothetical protein
MLRRAARIDQNAAIRIEQRRVDFGEDFQISPILEIEPGSAISQRISGGSSQFIAAAYLCVRIICIRIEKLLTVVTGNDLLPLR